MPNIEIWGMPNDATVLAIDAQSKQAWRVRSRIFALCDALPFANDMVVTIVENSDVCDRNGDPQPFLRICSSEEEHFAPIITALEPLNMDIETVALRSFHPKT